MNIQYSNIRSINNVQNKVILDTLCSHQTKGIWEHVSSDAKW